jgi:hypothetical protein
MGSPFKTATEYLNATGTLHSFTGHPGLTTVVLILGAVLTVYFLVKSFTIKH